ncbi:unnamed protein product [Phaeothamnion confervicola]
MAAAAGVAAVAAAGGTAAAAANSVPQPSFSSPPLPTSPPPLQPRPYDYVADFVPPSAAEIAKVGRILQVMRRAVSPIYFSTRPDGTVVRGLSGIPDKEPGRPQLFVGNHQLLALDSSILLEALLLQKGVLARGLAHPAVLIPEDTAAAAAEESNGSRGGGNGGDETSGKSGVRRSKVVEDGEKRGAAAAAAAAGVMAGSPGSAELSSLMRTFGAVPVTPRNMHRLLQRNEAVLLFPGGAREAFHLRGEEYTLHWPERPEFVRMAASAEAEIVPFAAIGVADSVNMLLDGDEAMRVPILGKRLRRRSDATPAARTAAGPESESFISPVVVPKLLPARFYFYFGQPFRVAPGLRHDRAAAQLLYEEVRAEVLHGIEALLTARQKDRYADPARRLVYETASGGPAPTFPASVLQELRRQRAR